MTSVVKYMLYKNLIYQILFQYLFRRNAIFNFEITYQV